MGKTLADGYLEIRPDVSKVGAGIAEGIKQLNLKAQARAAGRDAGDSLAAGFGDRAGAFARVVATTTARLTLVGTSAAAAAPGVLSLGAALAPAAGALVALPAAMAAVRLASVTLKIATAGVGDAINEGLTGSAEQAAEALKELPPAAAQFGRSVIALRPQVDALRASVAQGFFRPMIDDVQPLARAYLPLLRTEMTDLAGTLGGVAERVAETARTAPVVEAVRSAFQNTSTAVVQLRTAVSPLTAAFAAAVKAIAPELPIMAGGFANVAIRASEAVQRMAEGGRLTEIFQRGIQTIGDLGQILGNVGSILRSVFSAASAAGAGLLETVKGVTGQVAEFLRSVQGARATIAVFEGIASVGQALRSTLGVVLPLVGQALATIAPLIPPIVQRIAALAQALAPIIPVAAQVAALVGEVLGEALRVLVPVLIPIIKLVVQFASQLIGSLMPAIKPLIGVVLQFAAAVGAQLFEVLRALLPAVTTLVGAFVRLLPTFTPLIGAGLQLVTALLPLVPLVVRLVAALVSRLVPAIVPVVAAFNRVATTVISAVVPVLTRLVGFITGTTGPAFTALWRGAVEPAWRGISAIIRTAWENVIRPTVTALVSFWRTTLGPTITFLWRNVVQPAFTGIGAIIRTAWIVVKVILAAWVLYFRSVLAPVFTFLWQKVIVPAFNGIKSHISTVWNAVKPVLAAVGSFIRTNVAPAFRLGVDAIRTAWDRVRAAASVPVTFVVNSVLNPLIRGFNKIAGAVGVKDRISEIGLGSGGSGRPTQRGFRATGLKDGGRIPGAPSTVDNLLAMVAGTGRMLKVATGEFVTNATSTARNLPLVERVNSLRRRATMSDLIDVVPDGRALGGIIGDVWNAITNPKKLIAGPLNAAVSRIPAGGIMRDLAAGAGRTLIGGLLNWVGKVGGGAIGAGGFAGGWQTMQRLIGAAFPGLGLISGFRRGSRTLSGNRSYHSMGRAVDYPPSRALAAWIRSRYGSKTKELITPFQDLNLLNGRPHTYTGAVWRQHNFAGGNAHVHWAFANGGRIPVFDSGGTLAPGINVVDNRTGRPEPLVPAGRGDIHLHFHGPVASKQAAQDMVLSAVQQLKRERKL